MKPLLLVPGKLPVLTDVLDAEICRRVCRKSAAAARSPARVADGRTTSSDGRYRRAKCIRLPPYERSLLRRRILTVLPRLARCFRVRLTTLQRVQVLSYRTGDFFMRHRDNSKRPDTRPSIRRRRVSLVLFMNHGDASGRRRDYSGGRLNLYNVKKTGGGVCVSGEPGMLVAFPSTMLHEVTRVRSGERLTVVGWVS